jgi:hypothetical protein
VTEMSRFNFVLEEHRYTWPVMTTARATLTGVLVIAILVNIGQFYAVDASAPENYQAISRKPSSDIVDIVSQDPAVAKVYGPYWAISQERAEAAVQVSADDADSFRSFRFFSLGYGRAASVLLSTEVLADITSLDALLADAGVASVETGASAGHGHAEEGWYYIRGECSNVDSPSLIFGHLPDETREAFVIVDSCLLPKSGFNK